MINCNRVVLNNHGYYFLGIKKNRSMLIHFKGLKIAYLDTEKIDIQKFSDQLNK